MNAMTAPVPELSYLHANPAEAAKAIRAALKANVDPDTLYRALRGVTWRLLTERRYDGDARAWLDLMRRTGAHLRGANPEAALKLGALSDLLFESVQFGQHEPVEDILSRAHVRQLLGILKAGEQRKAVLAARLRLKGPNLSRVLSLVQSANLVERTTLGKEAIFRLSRLGEELAATLPAPADRPPRRVDTPTEKFGYARLDPFTAYLEREHAERAMQSKKSRGTGALKDLSKAATSHTAASKRARKAEFRARLDKIFGNQPKQGVIVEPLEAAPVTVKLHFEPTPIAKSGYGQQSYSRVGLQSRDASWGEDFLDQRPEHVRQG
ncbi:hypothetical protein [Phenylobacterium sp.]|uniref:hypothetical protein n=1 Tax=Phenylobacterium sp. TaxID=1871053 RepID=UPI002FE1B7B7